MERWSETLEVITFNVRLSLEYIQYVKHLSASCRGFQSWRLNCFCPHNTPHIVNLTVKHKVKKYPVPKKHPSIPELVNKSPSHSAAVPQREFYLYVHCRDPSHFSFNSSSLIGVLERAGVLAALALTTSSSKLPSLQ